MRRLILGCALLGSWSASFKLVAAQSPAEEPTPSQVSTPTVDVSKSSPEVPAPARPTMQKYAENLAILLQNLRAFENNPNKEQKNAVIQALEQLKGLSHNVQATMVYYSVDPVMRYLSLDLPKQFSRIETAYTSGNYNHARYLLRQTTQYCVGCHSASANKNSTQLNFAEPLQNLSELEKAEYYSATRRHEKAMLAYEKFLTDKKFKISQPELWLKAVQNLLAITIRMRNDAPTTLEMISTLLEEGSYLPQQKDMLRSWRASAKSWSLEKINQKLSTEELFKKAQGLLDKGDALSAKVENLGYIEYMRAMTLYNELAMSNAPDALKAISYLKTGQTSENLKDVFIWMRPEAYYEACIRLRPHFPEAKACWKQLQFYQSKEKDQVFEQEKFAELMSLGQ